MCTHAKRDRRCAEAGTLVLNAVRDEIEAKNLQNKLVVYEMSHVGGHSLAGNVLFYPGGKKNLL